MTVPTYTFNEQEAKAAHDEWGFNCGPAALAFALQLKIDAVRHTIPQFDERRYTSPTMMRSALDHFGRDFSAYSNPGCGQPTAKAIDCMFAGPMTLVRVQFTGPWIVDGKPQKWAARQTHWIATWRDRGLRLVFDINGGKRPVASWEEEVLPAIVATVKRADGGWYPANVWRLRERRPGELKVKTAQEREHG